MTSQTKTLPTKIFENYEPIKYYKDIETTHCHLDHQDEYDIDHTEEVIIGSEQGTAFPTKKGTTVCNALIDTGATRCCISEEYYRKLQLSKIHLLQNVNVRSATGSNLAPIGLINCIFVWEIPHLTAISLYVKISLDHIYWEEIFSFRTTFL